MTAPNQDELDAWKLRQPMCRHHRTKIYCDQCSS